MKHLRMLPLIVLAAGCTVAVKPINIDSDPNQERLERMSEKSDLDSMNAFIAEHPELDDQTKKELKDGIITRHEALERLKKNKPPAANPPAR